MSMPCRGLCSGSVFERIVTKRYMRRLIDRFKPGDAVEITFAGGTGENWLAGQVVALDAPGVWVRLADGRHFFVTNTRRIRSKMS